MDKDRRTQFSLLPRSQMEPLGTEIWGEGPRANTEYEAMGVPDGQGLGITHRAKGEKTCKPLSLNFT